LIIYHQAEPTIWASNATYKFDIFGIGQDDGSGLSQSSSNSMNTGSGDGTGQSGKGNIVLSNPSDLGNLEFLMIGHDNSALTFSGTELPGSMSDYYRTAREWYVDKTGDVGTVKLTFDLTGIPGVSVIGAAADYAILLDDNADFSNATKVDASSLNGNVITFNTLALTDGQYISFAAKISALPVELTSFTAASTSSATGEPIVVLNWETATEVNNYGFEVERSPKTEDGNQNDEWTKIGFVQGNGNSNSPKSYEFIDENPLAGNLQYRLKQIDTDGTYTYYGTIAEVNNGITGIDEQIIPEEYSLSQNYPNPFNPSTTIKYSVPEMNNVQITIYNSLGQTISELVNEMQPAGYYEVTFDASQLSSGLYFYSLTAGSFNSVKKMLMVK
jgi:hypothetical protein